jgi:hypothetical protein
MADAINCRLSKGSDQSKTNEIEGAYGKYGGQENCIRGLVWGHLKEKDHLEDLGLDGSILLNRSKNAMEWCVLDSSA